MTQWARADLQLVVVCEKRVGSDLLFQLHLFLHSVPSNVLLLVFFYSSEFASSDYLLPILSRTMKLCQLLHTFSLLLLTFFAIVTAATPPSSSSRPFMPGITESVLSGRRLKMWLYSPDRQHDPLKSNWRAIYIHQPGHPGVSIRVSKSRPGSSFLVFDQHVGEPSRSGAVWASLGTIKEKDLESVVFEAHHFRLDLPHPEEWMNDFTSHLWEMKILSPHTDYLKGAQGVKATRKRKKRPVQTKSREARRTKEPSDSQGIRTKGPDLSLAPNERGTMPPNVGYSQSVPENTVGNTAPFQGHSMDQDAPMGTRSRQKQSNRLKMMGTQPEERRAEQEVYGRLQQGGGTSNIFG